MAKKSEKTENVRFEHSKNKRTRIVGERSEFKGKDLVNIREFKLSDDDDELLPTKSGFTIPAEQFYDFFKKLRKFGREAGLLPEPGEDAKAFVAKLVASMDGEEESDEKPSKGKKKIRREDDAPKKKATDKKAKKKKVDKEAVKKAKFDKKKRPHI